MRIFSDATDGANSQKDILLCETKVLNKLNWEINYPNFATHINDATCNWDEFIENFHKYCTEESQQNLKIVKVLKDFKFRDKSTQCFNLFISLTNLVDVIVFDLDFLKHTEKFLVVATIYILILRYYNIVNFSRIYYLSPENVYHVQDLNLIFDIFLNRFYNVEFCNIFEHVQHVSCYVDSEIQFEGYVLTEDVIIYLLIYFIFLGKKRNI